jgi:hypothetical protein
VLQLQDIWTQAGQLQACNGPHPVFDKQCIRHPLYIKSTTTIEMGNQKNTQGENGRSKAQPERERPTTQTQKQSGQTHSIRSQGHSTSEERDQHQKTGTDRKPSLVIARSPVQRAAQLRKPLGPGECGSVASTKGRIDCQDQSVPTLVTLDTSTWLRTTLILTSSMVLSKRYMLD